MLVKATWENATRRKLLSAGAALGGAASLAACGAHPGGESKPAETKVAGSIDFWHWGVTYVDGFDKLVAEFQEKNSGAKVVRTMPDNDQTQIPVTVVAGSGGPDAYLIRGNNFRQWANGGLTADLGSYLSRDKVASADVKTVLKSAGDFYALNGKQMGLPWDLSTISVTYSLDAMDRRGMKPPAELGAGWDWNAYIDYCKRMNPGDGSKYAVDQTPGIETGWYNWAAANGAKLWTDDFKTITANTPELVEAVDQYMSVPAKLKASPPRDWLAEQTKGLPHAAYRLVNGIVFMQTAGDWFFAWYEKEKSFAWDVAPMPYSPRTKKTGSVANLRGSAMAPTAQNRDLAWAWMTFLLKRDVQDRVPSLMGEVPARNDSIEQVYLNPAKMPSPKNRKLLKASLDATVPLPSHPVLSWSDINGSFNALNDVYDAKRQTRDVLIEIQDKLTAMLRANTK